jgi:hypothetical protein
LLQAEDDTRALASDKARNFVHYFLAHLVPNVWEVEFSVSKQLVHAQTRMTRELCASMPRLRKLVSLPQPEWISSPQMNILNYARVHLFNLDGDDFKDAAYLDVLHLDCHILHDRDKLERHILEEMTCFKMKTGTCSKNVNG